MSRIEINEDGEFQVDGRSYTIPGQLTRRVLSNYRTLLRPIPDIRGGTRLTEEQRATTENYLSRRAAAGVIPGFDMHASASLSTRDLRTLHRWIASHRLPVSEPSA